MNASQWTCLCMLALAASQPAQAAATPEYDSSAPVMPDASIDFNHQAVWQSPDLSYVRLLAERPLPGTHWSVGVHQAAAAPSVAALPSQPIQPAAEVPEASMVSMLLVGLGLLALGVHGERQEKF